MSTAWKEETLSKIRLSAFAVSTGVTILVMAQIADWSDVAGVLVFMVWAVLPYGLVMVTDIALRRVMNRKSSIVLSLASLSMLAFTLFAYLGTLGDKSSTYGLIFVFVPLYLTVGGVLLLAVGMLWAFLSKPDTGENKDFEM